jgi:hypothetical protein
MAKKWEQNQGLCEFWILQAHPCKCNAASFGEYLNFANYENHEIKSNIFLVYSMWSPISKWSLKNVIQFLKVRFSIYW